MERGFHHPDLGYWQAIAGDAEDLLESYPEGTVEVSLKPGEDYDWVDGAWVHVPPPPSPATADMVIAERERRLALGFDYDFGDERGIHHIATTPDDIRKWMDEVTPLAQSYINLGQPAGEITISTDKGMVVITAMEWQSILVAAAGYRQPLYAASFALMAMDPIPLDYADNAYWP